MNFNQNALDIVATTIPNHDITAIITFQQRHTAVVESIIRCVVSLKTEEGYLNRNVHLVLWLYDNEGICEELFKDWIVDATNKSDNLDKALASPQ